MLDFEKIIRDIEEHLAVSTIVTNKNGNEVCIRKGYNPARKDKLLIGLERLKKGLKRQKEKGFF